MKKKQLTFFPQTGNFVSLKTNNINDLCKKITSQRLVNHNSSKSYQEIKTTFHAPLDGCAARNQPARPLKRNQKTKTAPRSPLLLKPALEGLVTELRSKDIEAYLLTKKQGGHSLTSPFLKLGGFQASQKFKKQHSFFSIFFNLHHSFLSPLVFEKKVASSPFVKRSQEVKNQIKQAALPGTSNLGEGRVASQSKGFFSLHNKRGESSKKAVQTKAKKFLALESKRLTFSKEERFKSSNPLGTFPNSEHNNINGGKEERKHDFQPMLTENKDVNPDFEGLQENKTLSFKSSPGIKWYERIFQTPCSSTPPPSLHKDSNERGKGAEGIRGVKVSRWLRGKGMTFEAQKTNHKEHWSLNMPFRKPFFSYWLFPFIGLATLIPNSKLPQTEYIKTQPSAFATKIAPFIDESQTQSLDLIESKERVQSRKGIRYRGPSVVSKATQSQGLRRSKVMWARENNTELPTLFYPKANFLLENLYKKLAVNPSFFFASQVKNNPLLPGLSQRIYNNQIMLKKSKPSISTKNKEEKFFLNFFKTLQKNGPTPRWVVFDRKSPVFSLNNLEINDQPKKLNSFKKIQKHLFLKSPLIKGLLKPLQVDKILQKQPKEKKQRQRKNMKKTKFLAEKEKLLTLKVKPLVLSFQTKKLVFLKSKQLDNFLNGFKITNRFSFIGSRKLLSLTSNNDTSLIFNKKTPGFEGQPYGVRSTRGPQWFRSNAEAMEDTGRKNITLNFRTSIVAKQDRPAYEVKAMEGLLKKKNIQIQTKKLGPWLTAQFELSGVVDNSFAHNHDLNDLNEVRNKTKIIKMQHPILSSGFLKGNNLNHKKLTVLKKDPFKISQALDRRAGDEALRSKMVAHRVTRWQSKGDGGAPLGATKQQDFSLTDSLFLYPFSTSSTQAFYNQTLKVAPLFTQKNWKFLNPGLRSPALRSKAFEDFFYKSNFMLRALKIKQERFNFKVVSLKQVRGVLFSSSETSSPEKKTGISNTSFKDSMALKTSEGLKDNLLFNNFKRPVKQKVNNKLAFNFKKLRNDFLAIKKTNPSPSMFAKQGTLRSYTRPLRSYFKPKNNRVDKLFRMVLPNFPIKESSITTIKNYDYKKQTLLSNLFLNPDYEGSLKLSNSKNLNKGLDGRLAKQRPSRGKVLPNKKAYEVKMVAKQGLRSKVTRALTKKALIAKNKQKLIRLIKNDANFFIKKTFHLGYAHKRDKQSSSIKSSHLNKGSLMVILQSNTLAQQGLKANKLTTPVDKKLSSNDKEARLQRQTLKQERLQRKALNNKRKKRALKQRRQTMNVVKRKRAIYTILPARPEWLKLTMYKKVLLSKYRSLNHNKLSPRDLATLGPLSLRNYRGHKKSLLLTTLSVRQEQNLPLYNKKEFYNISNRVLSDFKEGLWKSPWLRSNLNTYLKKIKGSLTTIKKVFKENSSTPLEWESRLNQTLGVNKGNNKKNLSFFLNSTKEGQTVLHSQSKRVSDYNQITYNRIQQIITKIKYNLPLGGKLDNDSVHNKLKSLAPKMGLEGFAQPTKPLVHNPEVLRSKGKEVLTKQIVKNQSIFGNQFNPFNNARHKLKKPIIKDFSFFSYKNLLMQVANYKEHPFFMTPFSLGQKENAFAGKNISNRSVYWALNKTNIGQHRKLNKKAILWANQKQREEIRGNKTKKFINKALIYLNTPFQENYALSSFNNNLALRSKDDYEVRASIVAKQGLRSKGDGGASRTSLLPTHLLLKETNLNLSLEEKADLSNYNDTNPNKQESYNLFLKKQKLKETKIGDLGFMESNNPTNSLSFITKRFLLNNNNQTHQQSLSKDNLLGKANLLFDSSFFLEKKYSFSSAKYFLRNLKHSLRVLPYKITPLNNQNLKGSLREQKFPSSGEKAKQYFFKSGLALKSYNNLSHLEKNASSFFKSKRYVKHLSLTTRPFLNRKASNHNNLFKSIFLRQRTAPEGGIFKKTKHSLVYKQTPRQFLAFGEHYQETNILNKTKVSNSYNQSKDFPKNLALWTNKNSQIQNILLSGTILFHLCSLYSLANLSQIRGVIKYFILLFLKISTLYLGILTSLSKELLKVFSQAPQPLWAWLKKNLVLISLSDSQKPIASSFLLNFKNKELPLWLYPGRSPGPTQLSSPSAAKFLSSNKAFFQGLLRNKIKPFKPLTFFNLSKPLVAKQGLRGRVAKSKGYKTINSLKKDQILFENMSSKSVSSYKYKSDLKLKGLFSTKRGNKEISLTPLPSLERGFLKRAGVLSSQAKIGSLMLFTSFFTGSIRLTYFLYDCFLKVIEMPKPFIRSIKASIEKPGQVMFSEGVINFFLVEIASDLTTIIPETLDASIWYSFSKVAKASSFSFINKAPFIGTLLEKRLLNIFELLLETSCQPDTDLIVRQKKGQLFWDIWGEALKNVAAENNINISLLSEKKEDQSLLLSQLLENNQNSLELRSKSGKLNSIQFSAKNKNFFDQVFGFNKPKHTLGLTAKMSSTGQPAQLSWALGNSNTKLENIWKRWSANQFLTYKGKDSDLFIQSPPAPKSFKSLYGGQKNDKYFNPKNIPLYTKNQGTQGFAPIGTLICQIYSGLFYKETAKNFLVVGSTTLAERATKSNYDQEKSLLIQSLAGETEMKIIRDNANRYNFALGIKSLRNVFDALALHTPCIFLIEDIHIIGERRPLLVGDDENAQAAEDVSSTIMEPQDEKNFSLAKLNRHSVMHYKKPFKGEFSLLIPANTFAFDLFLGVNSPSKGGRARQAGVTPINPIQLESGLNTDRLSLTKKQSNQPVNELPWLDMPSQEKERKVSNKTEPTPRQRSQTKTNSSIRVKIALLANFAVSNLSVKLNMITDLLIIIDSVRSNRGFVVFATTHTPSSLDPALRRPGRLDETIALPYIPKLESRWESVKSNFGKLNGTFKPFSLLAPICKPVKNQLSGYPLGLTVDLLDYGLFNVSLSTQNLQTNKFQEKLIRANNFSSKNHQIIKRNNYLQKTNSAPNNLKRLSRINESFILGNNLEEDGNLFHSLHHPLTLKDPKADSYIKVKDLFPLPPSPSFVRESKGIIKNKVKERVKTKTTKTTKTTTTKTTKTTTTTTTTLFNLKNKAISNLKAIAYSKIGKLLINQKFVPKKEISLSLFTTLHEKLEKSEVSSSKSFFAAKTKSSANLSLYTKQENIKQYLMGLFAPKVTETFAFNKFLSDTNSWREKNKNNKTSPFLAAKQGQGQGYPNQRIDNSSHQQASMSMKAASSIIFTLIEKRLIYKKSVMIPKLLQFFNGAVQSSSLQDVPSPPNSFILLPAKRYENYKRSFFNHLVIGGSLQNQTNTLEGVAISFYDKIQLQQKRALKLSLLANSLNSTSLASLKEGDGKFKLESTLPLEKDYQAKGEGIEKEEFIEKPTVINGYYRNRILNRHRGYLNNQWWNGQLFEHNVETTFLSDVDWRAHFISPLKLESQAKEKLVNYSKRLRSFINSEDLTPDLIPDLVLSEPLASRGRNLRGASNNNLTKESDVLSQTKTDSEPLLPLILGEGEGDKGVLLNEKKLEDSFIDFPDFDQHYNPGNRRWVLQFGYWSYWYNFQTAHNSEIYSYMVNESYLKTFNYLNSNREIIDYLATKLIKQGLVKEISIVDGLKRF